MPGSAPFTIQRKLTLVMLLTCAIALICAIGALVLFDSINERQQILDRLNAQAEFIAENSTPALAFNQHDSAFDLLESLQSDPLVSVACIFNSQTNLIAHHVAPDLPNSDTLPNTLGGEEPQSWSSVQIVKPIVLGEKELGYVYLLGDLRSLKRRLLNIIGIGILVLLFAFGMAILISSYLQRFISQPIIELTSIANEVVKKRDYGLRASKRSNDEVGRLMEIFNDMLATIQSRETALQKAQNELELRVKERTKRLSRTNEALQSEITKRKKARNEVVQLNSKLIESTRRAGMAEVASSVLHNVGNVLNSVNVSAGVIRNRIEESEISSFESIVRLINENRETLATFVSTDPRGKKLPDYLDAFAEHLRNEEYIIGKEVENLVKNVDHIKEVIGTQQRHAVGIGITERHRVDDMVDEVVTLYTESLRQAGIIMIAEYEDSVEIITDKHKVIQILGNLILNGRDALIASSQESKQIHIKTRVTAEHRIAIQVYDNGSGIKKEDLKWIFTHGFTTKKDGHGLGLHSCAIAAQELNGSLRVLSDGFNKGATFILELPIE